MKTGNYLAAILMAVGFAVAVMAMPGRASAEDEQMEYWHIIGGDGCSEFIFQYDNMNRTYRVWWRCCGDQGFCYSANGEGVATCGLTIVWPTPHTGDVTFRNPQGDVFIGVPQGHGGVLGAPPSSGGACGYSFAPNSSTWFVITNAALLQ